MAAIIFPIMAPDSRIFSSLQDLSCASFFFFISLALLLSKTIFFLKYCFTLGCSLNCKTYLETKTSEEVVSYLKYNRRSLAVAIISNYWMRLGMIS